VVGALRGFRGQSAIGARRGRRLTSRRVCSSISAEARQPLSGVRISWHSMPMNSLLAWFSAARAAASAVAAASWRSAAPRARTSASSLAAAARARVFSAKAWRRLESQRKPISAPTAHATERCSTASGARGPTLTRRAPAPGSQRRRRLCVAAAATGAASTSAAAAHRRRRTAPVQMRKKLASTQVCPSPWEVTRPQSTAATRADRSSSSWPAADPWRRARACTAATSE
jgi:hypothetical protein